MSRYVVKSVFGIVCIGAWLLAFMLDAAGQRATGGNTGTTTAAETAYSGKPIPDVAVVDQNGRRQHFYTDLVKGRVVAINFVFTTCTTICPPLGSTFGRLEKSLGAHFDREIFLISVSVDPAIDTPERLRVWAAQFGAQPGWTLVTGQKVDIYRLLKALGLDTPSPESHSPTVLIINDKAGVWKRVYGLGSTAALTQSILRMMAAPGVSSSAKSK